VCVIDRQQQRSAVGQDHGQPVETVQDREADVLFSVVRVVALKERDDGPPRTGE